MVSVVSQPLRLAGDLNQLLGDLCWRQDKINATGGNGVATDDQKAGILICCIGLNGFVHWLARLLLWCHGLGLVVRFVGSLLRYALGACDEMITSRLLLNGKGVKANRIIECI
jgi:hypothetical protein